MMLSFVFSHRTVPAQPENRPPPRPLCRFPTSVRAGVIYFLREQELGSFRPPPVPPELRSAAADAAFARAAAAAAGGGGAACDAPTPPPTTTTMPPPAPPPITFVTGGGGGGGGSGGGCGGDGEGEGARAGYSVAASWNSSQDQRQQQQAKSELVLQPMPPPLPLPMQPKAARPAAFERHTKQFGSRFLEVCRWSIHRLKLCGYILTLCIQSSTVRSVVSVARFTSLTSLHYTRGCCIIAR